MIKTFFACGCMLVNDVTNLSTFRIASGARDSVSRELLDTAKDGVSSEKSRCKEGAEDGVDGVVSRRANPGDDRYKFLFNTCTDERERTGGVLKSCSFKNFWKGEESSAGGVST